MNREFNNLIGGPTDEDFDIEDCERCGDRPGTHVQCGQEITPTDRGDEVRETKRWVCDVCDPRRAQ